METPPKPTETNSAPVNPPESKPVKEKKPRSEAQQAATAKALAAMTAARKERAKKQIEKKEEIKVAKKAVTDKILKEDVGLVTRQDFEHRIGSLSKELMELRALHEASKMVKEAPAPPKAERIVERIIEKAPTIAPTPVKLTGHALLDKLFFEK